jgi:hypothetical protein
MCKELAKLLEQRDSYHKGPPCISSIHSVEIHLQRESRNTGYSPESMDGLVQLLGLLTGVHTLKIFIGISILWYTKNNHAFIQCALVALPNLKCAILYTSKPYKKQTNKAGPNSFINFGLGDILNCQQLHLLDLTGLYHDYHDITTATLSLQPTLHELRLPWMFNNKRECVLDFIADTRLHCLQTLIVGTFVDPSLYSCMKSQDAMHAAFLQSLN